MLVEQIIPGELVVARGLLNEETAAKLRTETESLLSEREGLSITPPQERRDGDATTLEWELDTIYPHTGETMMRLHEQLGTDDGRIAANYMPRGYGQWLHQDFHSAVIFNLGGLGAFHYSLDTELTPKSHLDRKTVSKLEPGDVIAHRLPHLLHHGENAGQDDRYSLVFLHHEPTDPAKLLGMLSAQTART